MEKLSPTQALHKAVQDIKDVSATARRAEMALPALLRLRRGEALDIRISTLARLAEAMGKSTDEILGLEPPDPAAISAEKLKREEEADAAFQSDLLRGLEQIRARIAKGPKGARR